MPLATVPNGQVSSRSTLVTKEIGEIFAEDVETRIWPHASGIGRWD
jgi:hypothetical protein